MRNHLHGLLDLNPIEAESLSFYVLKNYSNLDKPIALRVRSKESKVLHFGIMETSVIIDSLSLLTNFSQLLQQWIVANDHKGVKVKFLQKTGDKQIEVEFSKKMNLEDTIHFIHELMKDES